MKHLKKLLTFLIALALITGLLPAFTTTAFAEGDADYQVRDDGSSVTITGYTGSGGDVAIPSKIGGKDVLSIESLGANNTITSIQIPATVTSISDGALSHCSALASITVLEGNTAYSSVGGILYNPDKTELAAYPAGKTDTTFSIPGTVMALRSLAFSNNPYLTQMTIPAHISAIGAGAFAGCAFLTDITVDNTNTYYRDNEGVLYDKAGTTLIQYPAGKTNTSFTVPLNVTTIQGMAFSGNPNIIKVSIPENITSFGDKAFTDCILLSEAKFGGNAPSAVDPDLFDGAATGFKILYPSGSTGWTPTWHGYTTESYQFAVTYDFKYDGITSKTDVDYSGKVTEPAHGDRTGYTFAGWYREESFQTPWNTDTDMVTSDMTLYAKWSAQYKVTFDFQCSIPNKTIDASDGDIISAPDIPGRTGYTLEGWYKEKACENVWKFDEDTVNANITLYAKWKADSFTIKYVLYDGISLSKISAYDTKLAIPEAPTRVGYYFDGWYKEATFQHLWNFDIDKITGAITLYAGWTEIIPVTISCVKTDVILYGERTGAITATAGGGNSATYEYSISGVADWQDSSHFSNLAAGSYTVLTRDKEHPANSSSTSVTISQPNFSKSYAANKMPSTANTNTAINIIRPPQASGYTFVSLTYISNNTGVAVVTSNGNVTFLNPGKATITVTMISQATNGKTKTTKFSKTITVYQPVLTLTINLSTAPVKRTKTVKLTPIFGPTNVSNRKVVWISNDKRIATVSSSGVVTGKSAGKVTITCRTLDGSNLSAMCTIDVTPIYPESIHLSKPSIQITQDSTYTLKATISPSNSDNKSIIWTSSNTAVATVNNGKVTGMTEGTAVITGKTTNGLEGICTVTVTLKALSAYGKFVTAGMPTSEYTATMNQSWTQVAAEGTGEIESMDPSKDYSYTDLERIMKNLAKNEGVELSIIGVTPQGRNMYSLKVDYKPSASKKIVLLTGEIHAREVAGSVFILKELSDLIQKAKTDDAARQILEKVTFITIPVVNPDGREIIRAQEDGRKANAQGVDLGRNFPSVNAGQLGKGVKIYSDYTTKPGKYYYAGPHLGSEPEIETVMKWMFTYVPKATYLIDYHQTGHQVYGGKPWDTWQNEQNGKAFAVKIRDYLNEGNDSKYVYQPEYDGYGLNGAGGSLTDFAMSIATGMQFSNTYGRMVLKTGNKELPLLMFRDLDNYIGQYTPVNPGFKTASIEICHTYAALGYRDTARNLAAQEYVNYHFDGLLQFFAENALGE